MSRIFVYHPPPPVHRPLVHVKNDASCPNPSCSIKVSHDYQDLRPTSPVRKGVPQLELARFKNQDPFPTMDCWKVVSPPDFDPEVKMWVFLPNGNGAVRLWKTNDEAKGWVLYNAMTKGGGLVTRVAFRKDRRRRWKWW